MAQKKSKVLLTFVGERDPFGSGKVIDKKYLGNQTPHVSDQPEQRSFGEKLLSLFGIGNKPQVKNVVASKAETPSSEGAVLTICGKVMPDIVFLFPTAHATSPDRNTENNAKKVVEVLHVRLPKTQCFIYPLEVKDPTDFEELSVRYAERIEQACAEHLPQEIGEYEYHINGSSGTQQMAALAYTLVNSGIFPGIQCWQSKAEHDLKEGEPRVRRVYTGFLDEVNCMRKIESDLKTFNFLSLSDNFKRLDNVSSKMSRADAAKELVKVFHIYAFQDQMRFNDAFGLTQNVDLSVFSTAVQDILKQQWDVLRELQLGKTEETEINLTELYFNLQRCFYRGAHADVLARFYRLGEGCYYYRLRNYYHEDPNPKNGQSLGFKMSGARLKALGDDGYIKLLQKYRVSNKSNATEISRIIYDRNRTIVAHGMGPATLKDAKKCVDIGRDMLLFLVGGTKGLLENYPFKYSDLAAIVNSVK